MSRDYHDQIVVKWDGKLPMDEHDHYLDPNTIRPVESTHPWNYRKHQPYKKVISARKVALDHVCYRELLGNRRKFYWATELTNPYGLLGYAVGNGDDFYCFDYDFLPDGRVVLDSTINSETGCFIMGGDYEVVSPEDAPNVALGMVDQAITWACENGVKHTKKGWNQDPYYFYRSVFYNCDPDENKPDFSFRELRMGGKRINRYCNLPEKIHMAIF